MRAAAVTLRWVYYVLLSDSRAPFYIVVHSPWRRPLPVYVLYTFVTPVIAGGYHCGFGVFPVDSDLPAPLRCRYSSVDCLIAALYCPV